jgi:hypothetical protein
VSFLLPSLRYSSRFSAGTRDQSYISSASFQIVTKLLLSSTPIQTPQSQEWTYLVEVDDRLPEMVALLVEIPHADLSKVPGMVLVQVCSVVVLSTSQTATTGMLAVLSYTTITGGDVTAAISQKSSALHSSPGLAMPIH